MILRGCTDVDHIGSTFGGTINIDICSTFASLFNRHWHFLESVPNFWHVSSWKCLKLSLFVCVCVFACICIYIYIKIWFCIFQHMILVFLGFFSVINCYIFDISIDICRESCRHSTSTFAHIWIDICAPPYMISTVIFHNKHYISQPLAVAPPPVKNGHSFWRPKSARIGCL